MIPEIAGLFLGFAALVDQPGGEQVGYWLYIRAGYKHNEPHQAAAFIEHVLLPETPFSLSPSIGPFYHRALYREAGLGPEAYDYMVRVTGPKVDDPDGIISRIMGEIEKEYSEYAFFSEYSYGVLLPIANPGAPIRSLYELRNALEGQESFYQGLGETESALLTAQQLRSVERGLHVLRDNDVTDKSWL